MSHLKDLIKRFNNSDKEIFGGFYNKVIELKNNSSHDSWDEFLKSKEVSRIYSYEEGIERHKEILEGYIYSLGFFSKRPVLSELKSYSMLITDIHINHYSADKLHDDALNLIKHSSLLYIDIFIEKYNEFLITYEKIDELLR